MIKFLLLLSMFSGICTAQTSIESCVFLCTMAIIVMLPEPKEPE